MEGLRGTIKDAVKAVPGSFLSPLIWLRASEWRDTIANTISESAWIARGERLAETQRGVVEYRAWWCEGEELDRKVLMVRDGWRGPSYGAARNAGVVYCAFPVSRHRDLLSFPHYLEVANLDSALGDHLLR
jgi:hypothetical protein